MNNEIGGRPTDRNSPIGSIKGGVKKTPLIEASLIGDFPSQLV
ncbi:hypothetical protein [Lysinibacillus parviboronicapiens]|nr:hypothetical protein [Lysinibacillus parviboronicapiens]